MSQHHLPYGGLAPRRVQPPGAAFMRGISRRTGLYSSGATRRSLPGYCPCGGSKIGIKDLKNWSPRWARHALPSSGSVTHCSSGYWWGCPGQGFPPPFVVTHPLRLPPVIQSSAYLPLPLPSPRVSSASRHSNPSLALCLAVVLTVYLIPSFLVAPLAQICAPVALSPLLPSSATSCAASGLGSAMWIPTQHPAQCDSNVPLVIGRGAPFHSVTWHSHGTIAGTCAGGGVPTGAGRPGLPLTTAGPWHSVVGTNEALKNEVQVPYQPGFSPAALNLKGGGRF